MYRESYKVDGARWDIVEYKAEDVYAYRYYTDGTVAEALGPYSNTYNAMIDAFYSHRYDEPVVEILKAEWS